MDSFARVHPNSPFKPLYISCSKQCRKIFDDSLSFHRLSKCFVSSSIEMFRFTNVFFPATIFFPYVRNELLVYHYYYQDRYR